MFAEERQNAIKAMLEKMGAVTTAHLVREFNVSTETVRRDLLILEKHGALKRVHGGAVKEGSTLVYSDLENRLDLNTDEKRELAEKAAQCILEDDILMIDSGSTAAVLAEELRRRFKRLTVITYSLDILDILKDCKEYTLILCGGQFIPSEKSFCGSLVLDAIGRIHAYKAFICPSAVSIEHGIGDFQDSLGMIQKAMLSAADKVYILADSSKFEQSAMLKVSDLRSDYICVTDSGISDELIKLYAENGITILKGGDKK